MFGLSALMSNGVDVDRPRCTLISHFLGLSPSVITATHRSMPLPSCLIYCLGMVLWVATFSIFTVYMVNITGAYAAYGRPEHICTLVMIWTLLQPPLKHIETQFCKIYHCSKQPLYLMSEWLFPNCLEIPHKHASFSISPAHLHWRVTSQHIWQEACFF